MDAKLVADARNFLRAFRNVVAFAEAIDQIGTIDTDINAVREEHRKANVALEEQRAYVAALRMEQNQLLTMIETAKAESRRVVKAAKEKSEAAATALMKAAEDRCKEMTEAARSEASAWDHRTKVAQEEFMNIKGEIAAAEKKLADTRAAMQKLIAGVQNGSV